MSQIKTIEKLKPLRMWIDGKCFNLKKFRDQKKDKSESEDDIKIYNIEFDVNANGKLSTSFQLPSLYYIRMKQGEFSNYLNTLKNQTKTNISILKDGTTEKLVISGDDENNIKEALNEVYSVIGMIRSKSMALQFLAIPLGSEEIRNNFENFKNEILKDGTIKGMDESIFQSSLKLHLTIDVFVLLDDTEKNEAILALKDYNETILKPLLQKAGLLKVHVAGIECMNDDYANVDVLYAKAKLVDETDDINLQNIANNLSAYFYERGLLKKHQEHVKLHMTLINTKYRKEPSSPKKRWAKRIKFDATQIMEKYRQYEFGECDLRTIHICKISSSGKDGFYEILSTITI